MCMCWFIGSGDQYALAALDRRGLRGGQSSRRCPSGGGSFPFQLLIHQPSGTRVCAFRHREIGPDDADDVRRARLAGAVHRPFEFVLGPTGSDDAGPHCGQLRAISSPMLARDAVTSAFLSLICKSMMNLCRVLGFTPVTLDNQDADGGKTEGKPSASLSGAA